MSRTLVALLLVAALVVSCATTPDAGTEDAGGNPATVGQPPRDNGPGSPDGDQSNRPTSAAAERESGDTPADDQAPRTLAQGDQSAVRVPLIRVIRAPSIYNELWRAITANDASRPAAPEIDFATETVVAVLMGERPTAGYSVRVDSVLVEGELITVRLDVVRPAPGDIVAQVLTSPYLLFALPARPEEIEITGDSPSAGFEGD